MTACACTHSTIQAHRAPVVSTAVLRLFLRKSARDHRTWGMPVAAYALVSGLLRSVMAGVRTYWTVDYADPTMTVVYRALATMALCILALPLINLASAAARMSTRRKDSRLAGLRLLGASRWTLRCLVVGAAALQALVGVMVGGLLYACLIPVLGLLSVDGQRVGTQVMTLPLYAVLAAGAVLVGLAAWSSALGLRRISIEPLAVRTRRNVPTMHWARILVAALTVGAIAVFWRHLVGLPEILAAVSLSAVIFGLPMLAMTWAGPWLVAKAAGRMHRRAPSAHHLVAARMILADPAGSWRQLQSVVLLGFVAVTVGGGLALISTAEGDPTLGHLVTDMRTGAVVTVLYGFLTVACAVLIDHSASVTDRAQLWRNLDLVGMPLNTMDRARRLTLTKPLAVPLTTAVGSAVVIQAPVLGLGVVVSPLSITATAVIMAVGVALVFLAAVLGRLSLTTTVRTAPVPAP